MIFKGYIFSVLYAALCLLIALLAYKAGAPKKYSRKFVHIFVGAEWIILSYYMKATYHFLIVCLLFTLVLAIAHFKKLMPMISSENDNGPGTVYYGVAMSIMAAVCLFLPDMMLPFGIGVFCTSFGDGFAGVFGQLVKKCNPKVYKNKSLVGSLANLVFSTASAFVISSAYSMGLKLWQCIMIGLFSVGLELITVFGFDNITITLGCAFLAYGFMHFPLINSYIIPIVITPLIIAAVVEKKVLTRWGLILALMLDAVVSLTLGNFGLVMLVAFLFGSVAIDKIKKTRKTADTVTKKGECRDTVQVLANGLIPMLMALLYSGTGNFAFIAGYIASLTEAFADTAASGVGSLSKNVIDIAKMKKIKPGLSGGVSLIGTLASLFGAALIALVPFAFGIRSLSIYIIVVLSAFCGVIFDSLLGSLLQVKYKCSVCSELTEREVHCKKRTVKYCGFEFFDNDIVNLLSSLFASVMAMLWISLA